MNDSEKWFRDTFPKLEKRIRKAGTSDAQYCNEFASGITPIALEMPNKDIDFPSTVDRPKNRREVIADKKRAEEIRRALRFTKFNASKQKVTGYKRIELIDSIQIVKRTKTISLGGKLQNLLVEFETIDKPEQKRSRLWFKCKCGFCAVRLNKQLLKIHFANYAKPLIGDPLKVIPDCDICGVQFQLARKVG